uniref:Uncharacterized protein n=1 Tax=Meloidogyne javanica TaxID=6303 RepID=A0A915LM04_MELJA
MLTEKKFEKMIMGMIKNLIDDQLKKETKKPFIDFKLALEYKAKDVCYDDGEKYLAISTNLSLNASYNKASSDGSEKEEGRTEHHHGLWLDCKRDYSYDYGRSKEYYATLHRHFDLARPFDQFWLTALNCVFKFDYWLDEKDCLCTCIAAVLVVISVLSSIADEGNRHYDPVPLAPENTTFSIGKPFLFNSDNEYLQPKSLTIDTSTISTRAGPPQLLSRISKQNQFGTTSNFNVDKPELVNTQKSSQFIKEFKESEKRFAKIPKVTFSTPLQQNGLPKPFARSRSSHRLYSPSQSSILTDVKPIVDDQRIGWPSNGIKRIPSEMDSSSLQKRKEEWTDV